MIRALLSTVLCLCALAIGMLAIVLAARNRARGAELDSKQRWCEIFSRQNEALRALNTSEEWQLVSGSAPEGPAALVPDAGSLADAEVER